MNYNATMQKIADLKAEREQQVAVIEAANARIGQIDAVLDAYRLLVKEKVLPESDIIETEEEQLGHAEKLAVRGAVLKVDLAIESMGMEPFEVSKISEITGFSRQTVRRVLNDEVAQGELRIVEQGSRRKPTVYQAVRSE